MNRIFQSFTRVDAAFAMVTAVLLAANIYYALSLNSKESRAWELNSSVKGLSEEHAACSQAFDKATGGKFFLAKDDDGGYYFAEYLD